MFKKFLTLNWVKENLSLIILVPTISGGIWQIMELAAIGTPYLRFFSSSQLISDGLLLAFIFFWLFIIFRISFMEAWTREDEEKANRRAPNGQLSTIEKLKRCGTIIFYLGCASYLLKFVWIFLSDIANQNRISMSDIAGIGILFMMITLLTRGILIEYFQLRPWKPDSFWEKYEELLIIPFQLMALVLLISLIYIVPLFHRSFLTATDFYNMRHVEAQIKKDHVGLKSFEVLYFNDKYIFVRIQPIKGPAFTEVKKFESFLKE